MIEKATNRDLKRVSEPTSKKPRNRSNNWIRSFKNWARSRGADCPAIDGIIKEANEIAGEIDDKRSWTPP